MNLAVMLGCQERRTHRFDCRTKQALRFSLLALRFPLFEFRASPLTFRFKCYRLCDLYLCGLPDVIRV
ncbi:hypothetical protein A1351_14025 [Methylosinus sp. R-45379]|nr:hypothetical protein A1351_14025 [Methylosinus sp. R-45379]